MVMLSTAGQRHSIAWQRDESEGFGLVELEGAIRIEVPGKPKGKGRPRFSRSGHVYTPRDTAEYEELVRSIYRRDYGGAMFGKGVPLAISVTACYPIPKSRAKEIQNTLPVIVPITKPDADNIAKIICDALNGTAYHDDAQVAELYVKKAYSAVPRTIVVIRRMGGMA